jgi:hypothetical protein
LFLLLVTLFCFASCSKKTAYISQQQDLAYQQSVAPQNTNATLNKVDIAKVDNAVEDIESPKTIKQEEKTGEKIISHKHRKNTFARVSSNIKEKAPKALKNLTADKLANVTLLASATQGKSQAMMERYLKLGIIFLIVGSILAYLLPWPLGVIGSIIALVGLIFLVLWLLELLGE